MNQFFNKFSTWISNVTGHSIAFVAAVGIIIVWLVSGPVMGFSDTWQLLINTLTTLITFLMVFVIQNTTNRANNAQQIKLDFLLQILGVDDKEVYKLEELDDKKLEALLEDVQERRKEFIGGSTRARKPKG